MLKGTYMNNHRQTTKNSYIDELKQWAEAIILAVIIAFIIRGFVFEPVYVDGESMENTLTTAQRLVVYKLGYYFVPPKAGDIVILQYEEGITKYMPFLANIPIFKKAIPSISEVDYIKRVIAVPGEEIDIRDDGFVYINGQKLDEPYVKDPGKTYNQNMKMPLVIPSNTVFVMGDNRLNSRDSRIIGLIEFNRIKGKAIFRLWPMDTFGKIYGYLGKIK
jgi:signal peptidase I